MQIKFIIQSSSHIHIYSCILCTTSFTSWPVAHAAFTQSKGINYKHSSTQKSFNIIELLICIINDEFSYNIIALGLLHDENRKYCIISNIQCSFYIQIENWRTVCIHCTAGLVKLYLVMLFLLPSINYPFLIYY